MQVKVDPDGTINYIYSDDLAELQTLGQSVVKRASHVEPGSDGKWRVDLSPIGGPTLPTTFDLRRDALAAEVEWIENNILGYQET